MVRGIMHRLARNIQHQRRRLRRAGRLPAPHGAFLTQRVLQGPEVQVRARGRHAQGDPCPGVFQNQRGEGASRGRRSGVHETEGGRQGRARRIRRDARVRALPDGALEANTNEQRHQAPRPRDRAAHAGRRHVPGRQERPHAGHPRLKCVADGEWGSRRYLYATPLKG